MLCFREHTAGEGLSGLVSGWEGPPEEVTFRLNPEACPGVVGGWREEWDKDDDLSWQRTGTFQHSLSCRAGHFKDHIPLCKYPHQVYLAHQF